jgi:hypothetical protein
MSHHDRVFGFLSPAARLFVLALSLAPGLPQTGGGEAKPADEAIPTALAS